MIVYKITNKLNGKIYIGQTVQKMHRRWSAHVNGQKSAISLALKKYGKENFSIEILNQYSSIEQLNNAEEYFIQYHNSIAPFGYNLHSGGNNHSVSEITRKRLSISNSGKKQTELTKNKRSTSLKGHRPFNTKPNKSSFKARTILCLTNGKIYESLAEAAKVLSLSVSKITLVCQGKRAHTKNFTFVYREVS